MLENFQFSLSVSTHCNPSTGNHWCSRCPPAVSSQSLAANKVARTMQKLTMGESPTLTHSKKPNSAVKRSACNTGDKGSNPESGRSSGVGNGNPLQYSCLGNPMEKRAWRTTVHVVAKSQTGQSTQAWSY